MWHASPRLATTRSDTPGEVALTFSYQIACLLCLIPTTPVVRAARFRFGFDVAHYREMSPRKEAGSPVQGQLIALVKRGEGRQSQPAQEEEQEDVSSEL